MKKTKQQKKFENRLSDMIDGPGDANLTESQKNAIRSVLIQLHETESRLARLETVVTRLIPQEIKDVIIEQKTPARPKGRVINW